MCQVRQVRIHKYFKYFQVSNPKTDNIGVAFLDILQILIFKFGNRVGYLGHVNGQEPHAAALRKQLGDPNLMYKELIHLVRSFVE